MISTFQGVRIAGIASAVPSNEVTLIDTAASMGISEREARKIAAVTGALRRRVAPQGMCTSDLVCQAAGGLLDEMGYDRDSIDALVLVTQTPDYDLPATACILQDRLGLPTSCAALDVSLGCSGFIYGLWMCSSLIASSAARRVLLLAGDTITAFVAPQDRSTALLFGDAGTATLLERDDDAAPMHFVLGTDGTGKEFLIKQDGAFRNPVTAASLQRKPDSAGRCRGPLDLYMDGAEVFRFSLEKVPPMVEQVLARSDWSWDQVDAFVPHQANLFMLRTIGDQLKLPAEKLIVSLDEYGNTSSASIPLALSHRLATRLQRGTERLILAGFGVGWSWGAAAVTCGPMVMPPIVCVDGAASQPQS